MPRFRRGPGGGRGRCRGRRWIDALPPVTRFQPLGVPHDETETVSLTHEELEAIRLMDLEQFQQAAAAERMGVSRRAFWNDLRSGRRKVAQALVEGRALHIAGGTYLVREQDMNGW